MKRVREGILKREIQALRTCYGYSLGYRSIHALLIKKAILCSSYLVRKVMKLAGFFGLPKKRKYPKGNYSPEIGNLIKGNFQSAIPHEKWFIDITQKRYLGFQRSLQHDAINWPQVKHKGAQPDFPNRVTFEGVR